MKVIILTVENGKRLPLDQVNEKRRAIKEKILETGMNYIETESALGFYNATGKRAEEPVFIIEDTTRDNYV